MKKFFKILGISLGSIVGLVAIVVGIAMYVVFTPARLTPIVNRVADSLLVCEHQIDEVELTFVRTFPNFGVAIKGFYVINPMEGAPSDTLVGAEELLVGVDLMKAIDGHIIVKECQFKGLQANLYSNADGQPNYDILRLESDTTEEDTTSGSWQLRSIELQETAHIRAERISYVDDRASIDARLGATRLSLSGSDKAAHLTLATDDVCLMMGGETYAKGVTLLLDAPVELPNGYTHVILRDAKIALNEFEVSIDGEVETEDWASGCYAIKAAVNTNDWGIKPLLALLPAQYADILPKGTEVDGALQLHADIAGVYDSLTMPVVDARLLLKDAAGHYDKKVLPYDFSDVMADLSAHLDLNDKAATKATINKMYARTRTSNVTLSGNVTEVLRAGKDIALANPLCQVNMAVDVNLEDAEPFLPKDSTTTSVKGRLTGTLGAEARLDDVTNMHIGKIKLNGDLGIKSLDAIYADSTLAQADDLHLTLKAPYQMPVADKRVHKKSNNSKHAMSVSCGLSFSRLHATMPGIEANLKGGGKLNAGVEIDTKDSILVPNVVADFALQDVVADIDTIHAHAVAPKGKLSMQGGKNLSVSLDAASLQAKMGEWLSASTEKISIGASARYNAIGENILLKWNPRLNFDLHQGYAQLQNMSVPVKVPQIKFEYNNHRCVIDTSRIVIGQSDFSLAGKVNNIGGWLRKEKILTGDLRFTSDHTNVDELLAIVNSLNTDEETEEAAADASQKETAATEKTGEGDPFMVPQRVDLTLTTIIREADAFDQHLKNLGGRLYIKDGVAVLEEMGFICEAAKLQLTAMYKTPRKNHIYVGMDYHMVDIDLQQLIAMVPQIDTLVPMLSSLRGAAQFHIAAETYVNSRYELKPSTLRGACSIEGKDLVLLDNETFSTIAKLLMFNKKTENLVDSISAQITLYKDEVTVYPFCLSMDNYMVAVGGNHYLDMNFNYHASVLSPIYLGVDVGGNLDDLDIKLAKCRYAKDFRPLFHRDVDEQAAALRKRISDSLKKSVKIE